MQPTRISPASAPPLGRPPSGMAPSPLPAGAVVLPDSFPLALDASQRRALQQRVQDFSFVDLKAAEVVLIGAESEQALARVLDGFLARIDQQRERPLFHFLAELHDQIDQEKLPELADRILAAKPTLIARVVGMVHPRTLRAAASKMFEDLERTMVGKTQSLVAVLDRMEQDVRREMQHLQGELLAFDSVKAAYRSAFVDFALDTAYLSSILQKAKTEFASTEPELAKDPGLYIEAKDRLQGLESRALAVEGAMSRLPADQLAISQQQQAGIATLQELSTTLSGRFSSIKMTLIKLNGTLSIRSVQRLGEQGAALDANLDRINARLSKEIIERAASVPGANRIEQAQHLNGIVTSLRDLVGVVEAARATNAQQLGQARTMMAQSRQEMLALSQVIDPRTAIGAAQR